MKLILAFFLICMSSIAIAAEKHSNERKPSSKPGDFWCTSDPKPIFQVEEDLNKFCDKSKSVSLAPQIKIRENLYVACCILKAE